MDSKINTFIFDCFKVICTPPFGSWYRENSSKKGFVDNNLENMFNDFDLGKMSEDDVIDYFSKYEGVNSTREKIREEIYSFLKLDNKLADMILKLKNKGFKTVLLSNSNSGFVKGKIYTTYPEFESLFNEIIISSDVGMLKPDKNIYLYALNKVNSKPEESLLIDDSKKNVDGATKLGINGFLYTDSDSFSEHLKKLGINFAES